MQRRFKPVEWSYNGSIYEVNIRQYTPEGTFNAFAAHLPRLREMGIQILWFMPITPISMEMRQGSLGSYYACSDYTAINPEFGTLDDFKALVKQAHDMGFKVIIDWVANHTGWDHVWTKTHPEYFKRDSEGKFYDTNNWHDVIDLNFYDGGLRNAMTDAMKYWVTTCDIDGFRCDMAHLVPLDFWQQARIALDAVKPLFWLGETEQYQYLDVFDCWYAWHWMSFTAMYCKQEKNLYNLQEVLKRYDKEFPTEAFELFFTTNHDENSWNGTEYEKYGSAAKALAVFSCTYNGLPLIYSGQELPNRKRLKFFDKDPIEWTGTFELHEFYKTLLQFRKQHPAFMAGDRATPRFIVTNESHHVLSFVRRNQGREVFVALNLSPHHLVIQLPVEGIEGNYTNIFNGEKLALTTAGSFELKGWDYLVLDRI
jgi:alpha-amylase